MPTLADLDLGWGYWAAPPLQLAGFRHAARRAWCSHIGENCPVCGCLMRFDGAGKTWTAKRYPTFDHIVPLGAGGRNELDNIWIICWLCNNRKSRLDQLAALNRGPEPKIGWARFEQIARRLPVVSVPVSRGIGA